MPSETTRPQDEARTINVTGQRLRVAIRPGDGTRTPLLLMNGIGVNLEVLQQFVDALDPAIEVIRFDVPGTGDSPAPLIPYRFSGLARLVTQMLDQLGYQQIDVLGVSWGGALAQQFAFQYLIRCRRLILVSTGTGGFMVPGNPAALAKIATPRRYLDPAYMAQIAGEIYGGKMRMRPELYASKMIMRPERETKEHRDPCLEQRDCQYAAGPRQESAPAPENAARDR